MRRYPFPFPYDASLWERHNFQPDDQCPLCGKPLVLLKPHPTFRLFRFRLWLACSRASGCDFTVLYRPDAGGTDATVCGGVAGAGGGALLATSTFAKLRGTSVLALWPLGHK